MKVKELRSLEESKLQKALEDAKKELIQIGKSSKKKYIRKQIARILTIMNERKKGITHKKELEEKKQKEEEEREEKKLKEEKKKTTEKRKEKRRKNQESKRKKSLKIEKRKK